MPNITSKELMALEDQLSAEQVLVKKYQGYASMITDPALKSKYEQIATKHQQHYQKLLSHLS
jgi:rubrerythrin